KSSHATTHFLDQAHRRGRHLAIRLNPEERNSYGQSQGFSCTSDKDPRHWILVTVHSFSFRKKRSCPDKNFCPWARIYPPLYRLRHRAAEEGGATDRADTARGRIPMDTSQHP